MQNTNSTNPNPNQPKHVHMPARTGSLYMRNKVYEVEGDFVVTTNVDLIVDDPTGTNGVPGIDDTIVKGVRIEYKTPTLVNIKTNLKRPLAVKEGKFVIHCEGSVSEAFNEFYFRWNRYTVKAWGHRVPARKRSIEFVKES